MTTDQNQAPLAVIARRHDLDALRAFAMLLGIALHAAMSFGPPWGGPPHDVNISPWFGTFSTIIHGFRLQLFFLVSGYFTMMLWRKRGALGLTRQRTVRILVPCLLGVYMLSPMNGWVYAWAERVERARQRDKDAAAAGVAVAPAPKRGNAELPIAVLRGDLATVQTLLANGADVNGRDESGSTPLHAAAFLGRIEVAKLLLDRGADPNAKGADGNPPMMATYASWDLTWAIANSLQISVDDQDAIDQGREKVRQLLGPLTTEAPPTAGTASQVTDDNARRDVRDEYYKFFRSSKFSVMIFGQPTHLVTGYTFGHLWFLWFLCWMTPAFVVIAWMARICRVPRPSRWLIVTPICLLWLVPLTLLPQWFFPNGNFGPDTCLGILPMPHLLVYYSVFFAFGALYFDCDDTTGRLSRWWWLSLPLALFVLYPVAQAWMNDRMVTGVTQVLYAWFMVFGMMGLSRKVLKRESYGVRYVSDASYWLYITHLPLVVAAQVVVQDWRLPAIAKFMMVCVVVTGALLIVYDKCVRYGDIGAILNGRKTRPQPQ
ncbi:MAG: acyltransferase family protein [Pirellulaceae bacterium]